jgi:hypothetical protein
MNRFRLPARVGPSPAAEEPGLQNSAARLRSSRDAQTRLLAEKRGEIDATPGGPAADATSPVQAPESARKNAWKREVNGETGRLDPFVKRRAVAVGRPRKEKLVVLFRLPLGTEALIPTLPGASAVEPAYALRALAKVGRAELRRVAGPDDLSALVAEAQAILQIKGTGMTVGEPMTVYVQAAALAAMHDALGDPWKVEPKARIVGAFLAAIVARLIETRRAG